MAYKEDYSKMDGVWRTIGGKRVFIKKGQSLSEAMRESGKFGKIKKQITDKEIRTTDWDKSNEYFKNLSREEKEAMNFYTNEGNYEINKALKQGNLTEEQKNIVKQIDKVINNYEMSGEYIVYRGTKDIGDLKVGDVYSEKQYLSTSLSEDIAKEFAEHYGDGTMLKITVKPNNSKGVYIGINNNAGYLVNEEEFLIQRNQKFKVQKVTNKNGIKLIEMETI